MIFNIKIFKILVIQLLLFYGLPLLMITKVVKRGVKRFLFCLRKTYDDFDSEYEEMVKTQKENPTDKKKNK